MDIGNAILFIGYDYFEKQEEKSSILLLAYTNYANALDSCGRVIEALRIYRSAIKLCPQFGMAIGNYGRALSFYANLVNDSGHYQELHCYAYQAIKYSLSIRDRNMYDEAIKSFEKMIEKYETLFNKDILNEQIVYEEYDLGGDEETEYRKWCLEKHLFLNSLNDLVELQSAFAHDPLTLTQLTESSEDNRNGEPPRWFAMLNQLKEEYIYSRYLCFKSMGKMGEIHYADKNVKLSLASYEYVNYSIRLEQVKSAFKNLFSLFDQIAFFINDFWNIGLPEREASAVKVFTLKNIPKNNIALMALYWGNCEFCEKFGNANSASNRDLKILRNAVEHKFVKIHEYSFNGKLQIEEDGFYHISEEELINQTIRLLELAREWIIELIYAIGIEESKKEGSKNAVHLSVLDYDDNWKL